MFDRNLGSFVIFNLGLGDFLRQAIGIAMVYLVKKIGFLLMTKTIYKRDQKINKF